MLRERTLLSLVLAAVLVAPLGALRPSAPDPLEEIQTEEDRFYLTKTHRPTPCDVVVLGDSRALRGIAPSAMEEVLPQHRVFNLAYNSGSLNRVMYAEAARRLDRSGGGTPDAVVVAVTPLSLLGWKAENQQYAELKAKPRDEVWAKTRFPRAVKYFQPISPAAVVGNVLGIRPKSMYHQTFHANGWIESERVPHTPEEALQLYAIRLRDKPVDPELLSDLVEQTRRWEKEGVRVFVVRLPTSDDVEALEERLTGFDPDALARGIEEAGGTWLRFENRGFTTYDGSHLVSDSARRFSRELAERMRSRLHGTGPEGP